jgi:hypothetical protein
VVVELFFVGMVQARVKEAFVAGLAAIGALEEQAMKDPLDRAISSRAVSVVGIAIRANRRLSFSCGFGHGDVLAL